MGRGREAIQLAGEAGVAFAELEDVVGQAQARFNLAAGNLRAGNVAMAEECAREGAEYLKWAERLGPGEVPRSHQPAVALSTSMPMTPGYLSGWARPDILEPLASAAGAGVTYRLKSGGWGTQAVQTHAEQSVTMAKKKMGLLVGKKVVEISLAKTSDEVANEVLEKVYKFHRKSQDLQQLAPKYATLVDLAARLAQIEFFVLPISVGDCFMGLELYEKAYLCYERASQYAYMNEPIEAWFLWAKIAACALAWGNSIYSQAEDAPALVPAMEQYGRVFSLAGPSSTPEYPDNLLYNSKKNAKLAPVGKAVKTWLGAYASGQTLPEIGLDLPPVLEELWYRWWCLSQNLDFNGQQSQMIPVWSFNYLQEMARYFTRQAIQAEREYISFKDKADQGALTRSQLAQAAAIATKEVELAAGQVTAAEADHLSYVSGKQLADTRAENAGTNLQTYQQMGPTKIWLDAANAWYGIGSQRKIKGTEQPVQEVVFNQTMQRGQMVQEYEEQVMASQQQELQQAAVVAANQEQAAQARVAAAKAAKAVADARNKAAEQYVKDYDNQTFTPDVWDKMAGFVREISHSYLRRATDIAHLMQRAYNFEFELEAPLRKIAKDYTTAGVSMKDGQVLAADVLLSDIDEFSYDMVTRVDSKQIPIKQTISLAATYPYQFETMFRHTGQMKFETTLDQFDLVYPGTYQGRIEALEVEIEGLLPPEGVRGALTNGGVSRYRTCSPTEPVKFRVQPAETMVLSEYRLKNDVFVYPADPNRLKLFQGAGVSGSWILDIPPAVNNLDYDTISDIRLTFYYRAFYNQDLATATKQQLAQKRPTSYAMAIPLRWMFPDTFFALQDTGQVTFTLTAYDFPCNVLQPKITALGMALAVEEDIDPSGWLVTLGVPNTPKIAMQPDAQGQIGQPPSGPWPWQPLLGNAALGEYSVALAPAQPDPGWEQEWPEKLRKLQNLVLVVQYAFTPRDVLP